MAPSWSAGQSSDLDQVVGEDPVSAPDCGSLPAVQAGAVPAVPSFEVADSSFRTGAPPDQPVEGAAMLEFLAGGRGRGLTGDRHGADAEFLQLTFDADLAVAAVGGGRPARRRSCSPGSSATTGSPTRCTGRRKAPEGLTRRPRLLRPATRPRPRPRRRTPCAVQPPGRDPARLPEDQHPLRRSNRMVASSHNIPSRLTIKIQGCLCRPSGPDGEGQAEDQAR